MQIKKNYTDTSVITTFVAEDKHERNTLQRMRQGPNVAGWGGDQDGLNMVMISISRPLKKVQEEANHPA